MSKVEDLASYLLWLPWRGIKSQPGRRFLKMKRNARGINIGHAEDENDGQRMKKSGNRGDFLEAKCMWQTDSEGTIR